LEEEMGGADNSAARAGCVTADCMCGREAPDADERRLKWSSAHLGGGSRVVCVMASSPPSGKMSEFRLARSSSDPDGVPLFFSGMAGMEKDTTYLISCRESPL